MRWIENYQLCNNLAAKRFPDKLIISIADREGDFYELMREYQEGHGGAHWIIRGKKNRILPVVNQGKIENDTTKKSQKLIDQLKSNDPIGHLTFEAQKTAKGRTKRIVNQEIRVARVTIAPPKSLSYKEVKPIEITAVLCTEIGAPEGQKPIEWILFTSINLNEKITATI